MRVLCNTVASRSLPTEDIDSHPEIHTRDHIQCFPKHPEFKPPREAAAMRAAHAEEVLKTEFEPRSVAIAIGDIDTEESNGLITKRPIVFFDSRMTVARPQTDLL